jgi:hypothetical protein
MRQLTTAEAMVKEADLLEELFCLQSKVLKRHPTVLTHPMVPAGMLTAALQCAAASLQVVHRTVNRACFDVLCDVVAFAHDAPARVLRRQAAAAGGGGGHAGPTARDVAEATVGVALRAVVEGQGPALVAALVAAAAGGLPDVCILQVRSLARSLATSTFSSSNDSPTPPLLDSHSRIYLLQLPDVCTILQDEDGRPDSSSLFELLNGLSRLFPAVCHQWLAAAIGPMPGGTAEAKQALAQAYLAMGQANHAAAAAAAAGSAEQDQAVRAARRSAEGTAQRALFAFSRECRRAQTRT